MSYSFTRNALSLATVVLWMGAVLIPSVGHSEATYRTGKFYCFSDQHNGFFYSYEFGAFASDTLKPMSQYGFNHYKDQNNPEVDQSLYAETPEVAPGSFTVSHVHANKLYTRHFQEVSSSLLVSFEDFGWNASTRELSPRPDQLEPLTCYNPNGFNQEFAERVFDFEQVRALPNNWNPSTSPDEYFAFKGFDYSHNDLHWHDLIFTVTYIYHREVTSLDEGDEDSEGQWAQFHDCHVDLTFDREFDELINQSEATCEKYEDSYFGNLET